MPPKLSILVVSYNTREITLKALGSVYAHPPSVPFELRVLDNASSDGSAEAIAAAFPQVLLTASEHNHGFARGNNLLAEVALGERLLLLNPDTEVFAGSLDALLAFADHEPWRGIWGGRTLFGDHSLNPTSCWMKITPWSLLCSALGLTRLFPHTDLFAPESLGGWNREGERAVDIVSGCYFLIERTLWQRLGGFDRTFFMYAEEADLCLRARRLGARPAVTGVSTIVHLGGASEPSNTEKTIKVMRGRMTLIRKHWRQPVRAFGIALNWIWVATRVLGSHVASGPRDGSRGQSRAKWAEIWRRRAEWLAGYPSISAGSRAR